MISQAGPGAGRVPGLGHRGLSSYHDPISDATQAELRNMIYYKLQP
jgi:hypothetical protein